MDHAGKKTQNCCQGVVSMDAVESGIFILDMAAVYEYPQIIQ